LDVHARKVVAGVLDACSGELRSWRAPSATETRAIVAVSGASTTLTKSKSPSVAHWWSTFAPSSSMSWFTSRSRSGFDFSVATPCCESRERRM